MTRRGSVVDGVYTKFEKESGKLQFVKPLGAWTLNLDEVDVTEVREIRFLTATREFIITMEEALARGWKDVFNGETKLIIPIHRFFIQERGTR